MRLRSHERRKQVARVALELLAEVSPERLTTRQVAEAAGVSQPALFRHFESREEILSTAIAFARLELESELHKVMPQEAPVRDMLQIMVETLLAFAERYPGLPRLFFYRAGGGEALDEGVSEAGQLEGLVEDLLRLVSNLLTRADVPAALDKPRAAELFIATLQGELLRTRLHLGIPVRGAAERAGSLVDHWWAGIEAGEPAGATAAPAAPGDELLLSLDVRPLLEAGTDPFQATMAELERLAPGGALVFTAPFKPAPLMAVMAARGFAVEVLVEGEVVVLLVRGPKAPASVDLRDCEAPEPLEMALLAEGRLAPGASWLGRLPRRPELLLQRLVERGTAFAVAPVESTKGYEGVILNMRRAQND